MLIQQNQSKPRSRLWRYAFALGSVGAAILFKILLLEMFGGLRFFLFWPVVILSAWYGGFGPGLLASVLSAVAILFVFPEANDNIDGKLPEIFGAPGLKTEIVGNFWTFFGDQAFLKGEKV